jgi:hypothetical protein
MAPAALAVDLRAEEISNLGVPKPVANLTGSALAARRLASYDWFQAAVPRRPRREGSQQLDLAPGSADIGTIPASKLVLVPMMNESQVVAYRVQ